MELSVGDVRENDGTELVCLHGQCGKQKREDAYCQHSLIGEAAAAQSTEFTKQGVAYSCKGRSLIAILQRTFPSIAFAM